MRRVCTEDLAVARVPKIPEGFSKLVFVYSRFDFILVVVNVIRTVAAGSTRVFHSIFQAYGCLQMLIYNYNELRQRCLLSCNECNDNIIIIYLS